MGATAEQQQYMIPGAQEEEGKPNQGQSRGTTAVEATSELVITVTRLSFTTPEKCLKSSAT